MIEREVKPELSYWEQNPQLKSRMHNVITMAYQTNNKILGKINSAFGEYPLVRIEMADRRGIFKEMPAKYINIMMDIYFSKEELTLNEIAERNGLNNHQRVQQINERIKKNLAIVRNRNLKYLDAEFQPLYQEEAQYEENRQKMEAQKKEAVQKRNKERREKDQQ